MNLGNTSKLWKLVCLYLSYLCILGNVASGGPGLQGTFLMKGILVSNCQMFLFTWIDHESLLWGY